MEARTRLYTSLAILCGVGLLACGAEEDPPPFQLEGGDSLALRLENDLGAKVFLDVTPGRPYAATATQARIVATGEHRGEAIRTFLTPYAKELGLDPNDLEIAGEGKDMGGLHHVVLRTKSGYGNNERGDGIDVTTDDSGHFVALSGELFPDTMAKAPVISKEVAENAAIAALSHPSSGASLPKIVSSNLAAQSDDGTVSGRDARLAYRVVTDAGTAWVDASTGALSLVEPTSMSILAPSVESEMWDPSLTFYRPNAAKEVETSLRADGNYELLSSQGSELTVHSLVGFNGDMPLIEPILSKDPASWDTATSSYQGSEMVQGKRVFAPVGTSGNAPRVAVDAFRAVSLADEFYRRRLNRAPLDVDAGSMRAKLSIVVHANFSAPNGTEAQNTEESETRRDNASFSRLSRAIFFGDGSYFYSTANRSIESKRVAPPALSLDVVGHELAHAFMEGYVGVVGEAGAINEGLADVVGTLFESEYDNESRPDVLGERTWIGKGYRNIANPLNLPPAAIADHRRQAATVKTRGCTRADGSSVPPTDTNDFGCRHENATIVGHAFFLMAYGGENPVTHVVINKPLRSDTARVISLSALGLTALKHAVALPQTFTGLARYQIDVARVLAPFEANSVVCAWHAVGAVDANYVSTMGFRCETSPPASCVGSPDGWYCDDRLAFAATLCRGGSTASGFQCAGGLACARKSASGRAALVVNGAPKCIPATSAKP